VLTDAVTVFRSPLRSACEERAFVLTAVQIPSEVIFDEGLFALRVSQRQAAHAAHHLHQYDGERRHVRPRQPPVRHYPDAWRGALAYVLLLLGVALIAAQHLPGLDLFAAGAMDGMRVQGGEWWRAWTALTLHWDAEHLLGNLGFGALFGYFAAQQFGNGRAWLLIVLGAGMANLIEGMLVSPGYMSAGASTAVFNAVGLIAANAWQTRRAYSVPGWRRAAPLVGGVMLLAWLGTEGEHTDVLSHGLGFGTGLVAGMIFGGRKGASWLARVPQRWAAAIAAIWLAACWALALGANGGMAG
jgi:membrane associated rhomboid family serine protease